MYRFQMEQRVLSVGDVRVGGQPGKKRTMLVGSLFYPRHSVVLDPRRGTLDHARLTDRLDRYLEAVRACACPSALMLYAESEEATRPYLEAVCDRVTGPLFADAGTFQVRSAFLMNAEEMGLLDRVVYNTINAGLSVEETEALRACPPVNAVVLAFNPRGDDVKGRIYMLENGDDIAPQGLISVAEELGIKNILIDTAATSPELSAGSALRAILVAKAKWGLPTGCALHNAVECLDLHGTPDPEEARRSVDSSAVAISILAGADYVAYGPFEYAKRALPVAAFADRMMEQAARDL